MNFGLQTYTVRQEIAEDFEVAFKAIKETGYRHIELPGLYEKDADELKKFFCEMGLSANAVMFTLEEFENKLETVLMSCEKLNSKYAVCGGLPADYRTEKGYLKVANVLDRAAKHLISNGITVAYHNHAFEFDKLESGKCGYDILLSETKYLTFELDVFWIRFAGIDPVEKMEELQDKISLVHLKDMNNLQEKKFCELGTGIIDLSAVIKAAERIGIEFAFVEQDSNWINDSGLESITKSIDWLNRFKELNIER